MKCRDCDIEMIPGQAMLPVYGSLTNPNPQRGDTVYPVTAALGMVLKCPECGHSVQEETKLIYEKDCYKVFPIDEMQE